MPRINVTEHLHNRGNPTDDRMGNFFCYLLAHYESIGDPIPRDEPDENGHWQYDLVITINGKEINPYIYLDQMHSNVQWYADRIARELLDEALGESFGSLVGELDQMKKHLRSKLPGYNPDEEW